MTEMLHLGVDLETIVGMVTSNPASMLGMDDEIGSLQVGRPADVSVLSIENGRFLLSDNSGAEEVSEKLIRPLYCLKDGVRYDVTSPLVPDAIAA